MLSSIGTRGSRAPCRPGSVAEDGGGSHGSYPAALLTLIDKNGVPIETSLRRVTICVRDATKGKQEPRMERRLTGEFYFIVNDSPQITARQVPANADAAARQASDSINTVATPTKRVWWSTRAAVRGRRVHEAGQPEAAPAPASALAAPAAAAPAGDGLAPVQHGD